MGVGEECEGKGKGETLKRCFLAGRTCHMGVLVVIK